MQHIFRFIAIKKLTEEDINYNKDLNNITKIEPVTIDRYFNTESTRLTKVTQNIYKALAKKPYSILDPEKELEKFYIKQLR